MSQLSIKFFFLESESQNVDDDGLEINSTNSSNSGGGHSSGQRHKREFVKKVNLYLVTPSSLRY